MGRKNRKESWEGFDFDTEDGRKVRDDFWEAVNILRDLAERFDRDELMDEVDSEVKG